MDNAAQDVRFIGGAFLDPECLRDPAVRKEVQRKAYGLVILGATAGELAPGGLAQTRSLRQIRTLAEQGSLNVSHETLDMLRVLRQNGSRLEVAAADLPATLPRMAELQRAAQVEFALVQQEGRYFLIRGLPEEVAFGRNAEMLLAHTHPGPSGFMALRPSLMDRLALPAGQDASMIIGADGRWIIFSRTGRPRILAGGSFP